MYPPAVRSACVIPGGRGLAIGRGGPTLITLIAVVVVACGGSATAPPVPTSTPAATAAPTPSDEPTAAPTRSAVATASPTAAQPTTFESVVYPYTLTMPAGVLRRQWRPATVPWDGQTPINRQSQSVDANGTPAGDLIVWAFPWTSDAASFGALVEDNTSRFNGCRLASEPTPLEVNGAPGGTYTQVCAQGTTALTVALVKDGYGLVSRVIEYTAPDEEVRDQLTEWMAGATWPVGR